MTKVERWLNADGPVPTMEQLATYLVECARRHYPATERDPAGTLPGHNWMGRASQKLAELVLAKDEP